MSTLKREWNACKICEHYYDETCDSTIKKSCNFLPSNDFQQFLLHNKYKLEFADTYWRPFIFLVEKDYVISGPPCNYLDKNLLSSSYEEILNELSPENIKPATTYYVPIDKELRDLIYKNNFIMTHYDIYMKISNEMNKKNIDYRLDERFRKIYTEKVQK